MRRILLIAIVFALIVASYVTSFAISTSRLVDAARAGDSVEVLARTDIDRVKRSLTEQIIDAYLERIGKGAKATTVMIANTYGSVLADAMLSKFLTADNLRQLLATGNAGIEAFAIPPISEVDAKNALDFLPRLFPINISQIGIRLSDASSGDNYAAVSLRFDGKGWKLATITLPKARVRAFAASLPTR